ncbi:hypothetical protein ACS0TY_023524 [Phlomoides rotata]
MISLVIPPGDQIARVTKILTHEPNIKSTQSVLAAQQRLKLYSKLPPNGLVLYTGTILTDDGKVKQVTFDFVPFNPINASLYHCDDKFHTEPLTQLLECYVNFGFIVMDTKSTLFGTLSGNTREVIFKFPVDLPKEPGRPGRGGWPFCGFDRLQMELCLRYVKRTAELATQFFINPATSLPNVSGLILVGSDDFICELSECDDMFDPRLQAKILNVEYVSSGGENGFNQAIGLSAEIIFRQEKRLIGKFFKEVIEDTGTYVFGVYYTIKALEMGAVETLIVWEDLDMDCYVLKNSGTSEIVIKYLNTSQESNFEDTYDELEVLDMMPLLEWFANEYRNFGCALEFVTNRSQEGSKFCQGFGGIGGILRYR